MIDYSSQSRGYKLWDEEKQRFVISRDVNLSDELTANSSTSFEERDEDIIEVVTSSRSYSDAK